MKRSEATRIGQINVRLPLLNHRFDLIDLTHRAGVDELLLRGSHVDSQWVESRMVAPNIFPIQSPTLK